jgi:hypothetical protein
LEICCRQNTGPTGIGRKTGKTKERKNNKGVQERNKKRNKCPQEVRFQVLTAASIKMAVFWVVAPCSLVEVYQRLLSPSSGRYILKSDNKKCEDRKGEMKKT